MSTRRFNFIYERLVNKPDDVVGLIAYGLYKQKKITYIQEYHEKNEGAEIPDEEIESFHKNSLLYQEEYKQQAVGLLKAFLDETLDGTIAELNESFSEQLQQRLLELTPPKPSFISGVGQSLVGSLGTFMVIGLLFCILIGFKIGFPELAKELLSFISSVDIHQNIPH